MQNKDALKETFLSTAYRRWEEVKKKNIQTKSTELKRLVNRDMFWKDVAYAYHIMMPIMYAIRPLDTRLPNVGKVWMTWWGVQQSLENPEELKDSIVTTWRIPYTRRKHNVLLKYFH